MRKIIYSFITLLCAALLVTLGWWAGATVQSQTKTYTKSEKLPTEKAIVKEFSVGKTYNFAVTISRNFAPVAVNHFDGVITALNTDEINPGSIIYEVAGKPVYAVSGNDPFFRDLERDIRGEDVKELQNFLINAGYLFTSATGIFGSSTEQAVKAWQKTQHLPPTGIVELGTFVALPLMPTSITFKEGIAKGLAAPLGEPIFEVPTGAPSFELRLNEDQALMVPIGSTVVIQYEGHEWSGHVSAIENNDFSSTQKLILTTSDGKKDLCGEECGILPAAKEISIPSRVEVEKPITGPAVPAAAVLTSNDSHAYVLINGKEREVRILGAGSGMVVLEGVEIGEEVELTSTLSHTEHTRSEKGNETPEGNNEENGTSQPSPSSPATQPSREE